MEQKTTKLNLETSSGKTGETTNSPVKNKRTEPPGKINYEKAPTGNRTKTERKTTWQFLKLDRIETADTRNVWVLPTCVYSCFHSPATFTVSLGSLRFACVHIHGGTLQLYRLHQDCCAWERYQPWSQIVLDWGLFAISANPTSRLAPTRLVTFSCTSVLEESVRSWLSELHSSSESELGFELRRTGFKASVLSNELRDPPECFIQNVRVHAVNLCERSSTDVRDCFKVSNK